jgi:hypothetical protein
MSNKNQTAIEWLFDKITQNQDIRWRGTQYEDLFEQAKAMEKEQIMDAFDNGLAFGFDDAWHGVESIDSTQYYKETYE